MWTGDFITTLPTPHDKRVSSRQDGGQRSGPPFLREALIRRAAVTVCTSSCSISPTGCQRLFLVDAPKMPSPITPAVALTGGYCGLPDRGVASQCLCNLLWCTAVGIRCKSYMVRWCVRDGVTCRDGCTSWYVWDGTYAALPQLRMSTTTIAMYKYPRGIGPLIDFLVLSPSSAFSPSQGCKRCHVPG